MTDFRYRAYLSYSHEDTRWATWLHRALEGYRVPSRLRGDVAGELPNRLAPVFRDRDDLSSARDLSQKLGHALEDSEHLIVICSPASARSRWVNQEIREYQALGRGDHIHCMIVDGDPQAAPEDGGCFPPALFEGVAEGAAEPLAADPRDFADGKRLALQKIAAGLLGVRLDDLRRRDLARRRRRQALAGLAAAAALVLAVLAISAKISERQERAQAEQMAAFIVDLGEDLKKDLDLESLGRMSTVAMQYLDQLDPAQLSTETRIKVSLALRQVGDVNRFQGKLEDAIDAYERSRGILLDLQKSFPTNDEVLFELSQAEFYSGVARLDAEEVARAREHLDAYLAIAKARHEADPDDPRWLLEYSYATSALVNVGLNLREPVDDRVLAAIDANIDLARDALVGNGGSVEALTHFGNELAFAADAMVSVCELDKALNYRRESLRMSEELLRASGASAEYQVEVALRHRGLAVVYRYLGRLEESMEHQVLAMDAFRSQLNRDPSNAMAITDLTDATSNHGRLLMYQGDLEGAKDLIARARGLLEPLVAEGQASMGQINTYRRLVFDEIDLARANGDDATALELLDLHRPLLTSAERGDQPNPVETAGRVDYRWTRWVLTGTDPAASEPQLVAVLPAEQGRFTGCREADRLARHAVMAGDLDLAREQTVYLWEAGYRDPDFVDFCRQQGLCPP